MKESNRRMPRVRIPPNVCHEILHNLFLGGQMATDYAEELEINFIVSIGARCKAGNVENVHIGIKDDRELNIHNELSEIIPLISLKLSQNKKVLVHCKAGMNRSPSFVLAFVCISNQLTIDEGMELILSKRPICKFSMKDQVALWLATQSNL